MTIQEIRISGFGKFHDRTFSFDDGINVIYGENESGKTTLHTFLGAMFFGLARAKGAARETDLYARFLPWQSSSAQAGANRTAGTFSAGGTHAATGRTADAGAAGTAGTPGAIASSGPAGTAGSTDAIAYGGSVTVAENGHIYRISRDFMKDPEDLTITDLSGAEPQEVSDPSALLKSLLGSLSRTAFENTVCIRQLKSATETEMTAELKNCIANLDTTGNRALNAERAKALLAEQRKSLADGIVPEAAKQYAADIAEIKDIERELSSPDMRNRVPELEEALQRAKIEEATLKKEREELAFANEADREKIRSMHFSDRADLDSYLEKLKSDAKRCAAAEYASAGGSRLIAALLFFGAAIAMLALSVWVSHVDTGVYTSFALTKQMLYAGLAPVFALLGILFLGADLRVKSKADTTRRIFLGTLSSRFPDIVKDPEEEKRTPAELMDIVRKETDGIAELVDAAEAREEKLNRTEQKLRELIAKRDADERDAVQQEKTQWLLSQKLKHLSELRNEAEGLRQTISENDRLRGQIEAIDLAADTMDRLSESIRSSFGLYLNKHASDLVRGITGGRYDSISIDDNLGFSINTEEKLIPLHQVSTGTLDQIYLAVRLAASDLMTQGGAALPLLFDDSFVNYDETRLRSTLRWLPEQYPGRQILIFTCHRREAQLLSSDLLPYRLTEL